MAQTFAKKQFCPCANFSPSWIQVTTATSSQATSQTDSMCVWSSETRGDEGQKSWGNEGRSGMRVEKWECCSLGCRLGGGAWKRPCRGLPLVESAQYPSNHHAPSLSSLPSANRAGEQETVWPVAMITDREVGELVKFVSQWKEPRVSERYRKSKREQVCACWGGFAFLLCLLFLTRNGVIRQTVNTMKSDLMRWQAVELLQTAASTLRWAWGLMADRGACGSRQEKTWWENQKCAAQRTHIKNETKHMTMTASCRQHWTRFCWPACQTTLTKCLKLVTTLEFLHELTHQIQLGPREKPLEVDLNLAPGIGLGVETKCQM